MDHWSEVRTAYAVARLGTITAAAVELNLHRATVIRHIELLEDNLGVRLFHRHARGYTPTETGLDLLRVAKKTDEQLRQFAGRVRGREATVSGEIVLTSLEIVAPIIIKALVLFRETHPETTIRYIASGKLFNLAHGDVQKPKL